MRTPQPKDQLSCKRKARAPSATKAGTMGDPPDRAALENENDEGTESSRIVEAEVLIDESMVGEPAAEGFGMDYVADEPMVEGSVAGEMST